MVKTCDGVWINLIFRIYENFWSDFFFLKMTRKIFPKFEFSKKKIWKQPNYFGHHWKTRCYNYLWFPLIDLSSNFQGFLNDQSISIAIIYNDIWYIIYGIGQVYARHMHGPHICFHFGIIDIWRIIYCPKLMARTLTAVFSFNPFFLELLEAL